MVYAVVGNPIVNNVGQLLSAILARKVYARAIVNNLYLHRDFASVLHHVVEMRLKLGAEVVHVGNNGLF